jgi:transcriptional regulator with XRE-family HTH domain
MNSSTFLDSGSATSPLEDSLPRFATQKTPIDDKALGERLRQLRKRRGLSQTELVSEYERGTVRIPATVLTSLAQTLKTSLDQLVGLKPPKENGVLHDRRFIRRLERIEKLPKRAKQALLKTIDTYLVGAEKR